MGHDRRPRRRGNFLTVSSGGGSPRWVGTAAASDIYIPHSKHAARKGDAATMKMCASLWAIRCLLTGAEAQQAEAWKDKHSARPLARRGQCVGKPRQSWEDAGKDQAGTTESLVWLRPQGRGPQGRIRGDSPLSESQPLLCGGRARYEH